MLTIVITVKLEEDKVIESPFILFKLNVSEDEFWSFARTRISIANCLMGCLSFIHRQTRSTKTSSAISTRYSAYSSK